MPLIKLDELPTRVVPAKTIRVQRLNCVAVRMQLDFGVQLDRKIIIESIDTNSIPQKLRHKAKMAMVVLVGGKHLFVHTADTATQDGYIHSRLYLNEKVFAPPEGVMMRPFTFDTPDLFPMLLEVGTFFNWLQEREFNVGVLKEVLNGRRRVEADE